MKPIGGYFELELPKGRNDFPHAICPAFNSGRHALEYILRQLGSKVKTVHLPYYTCDVVIEPLRRLNIGYQFYHINKRLEIDDMPQLRESHYLIANNYFGIKDRYIDALFNEVGERLIVDNSQAFLAPERQGMMSFYSPRKFVGVSDGGFACTPVNQDITINQDFSTERAKYLMRRIDAGASAGYTEFKESSHDLSVQPMKCMSHLTYRILSTIDFDEVRNRRRSNFDIIHAELGSINMMSIPDSSSFACPMVYPFMTKDTALRQRLIDNQIFVATYWPNVKNWCASDMLEYRLATEIIPLPIDQRYDQSDMKMIVEIIK